MKLLTEELLGHGGGLCPLDDLKCNGHSLGPRYISNKTVMKISSAVIFWPSAPLLVRGGGLRSLDDFRNVMRTSQDPSLVKFS